MSRASSFLRGRDTPAGTHGETRLEDDIMCEYCKEDNIKWLFDECSSGLTASLLLYEKKIGVDISYDRNILEEFEVPINYCPMCGRKL